MKKLLLPIVAMVLCSTKLLAQENTISCGGTKEVADGILTYSVGEIYLTLEANPDFYVEEGIHHVYQNQSNAIAEENSEGGKINVYPNPANEVLYFSLNLEDYKGVSYQIHNLLGEFVYQNIPADESNSIALENLPAGVYFIVVNIPNAAPERTQFIKN